MMKKSSLFAIAMIIIVLLLSTVFINVFPLNAQHEDNKSSNDTLEVYFLNVGQGDCILLKTANHSMLIDSGDIGKDTLVLNYLEEYNVSSLDYLVATHPHSDHIGSMSSVIRKMDKVNMVIMPNKTHTTKTYENLIKLIDEKNIPITIAKSGDNFTFGNASIQVLAPNSATYNNLNDYSVVLRVKYGETIFLFTGDAEAGSESEQLANGLNLKADVLKVGHHGSKTSSTQRYLNAVSPKYAVISSGVNNSYGHPANETISHLTAMGILIYRTNQNGTIIFTSDGKQIFISSGHNPIPAIILKSISSTA